MAKQKQQTEALIVELMQADPRRAIEFIIQQYGPALLWNLRKIAPNEEIAQDLFQEACVKIWQNADKYDPAKGRLFTWLVQVSRNLALDKIRTQKFKRQQQSETVDATVTNDIAFSEGMQVVDLGLQNQIRRLEPKYQQIIDLMYFQGYSQSEISKEFDIPLGTVKSRAKVAMRELRRLLGNYAPLWIGWVLGLMLLGHLMSRMF